MNDSPDDLAEALALHRAGRLAEAEALYRAVLDRHADDDGDAAHLLGLAVLQQGRADETAAILAEVAGRHPRRADVRNNLGVAWQAAGRWPEAARAFQAAIEADPRYVPAFVNLGRLMERRRLFADAEKCYRHAIELAPDDVELRRALGNALQAAERWDEAADAYRQALALDDEHLDTRVELGYVLTRGERLDEAADLFRGVLEARPDFAEIHNNLSYVLERQGRLAEATAAVRRALALRPDYAEGFNNLGTALRGEHRLGEAIEAFRAALALRPEFPLAEFNLGTTHLLAGDYAAGWPGYERRDAALGVPPRFADARKWNGEPLSGGTLFVYADQGFGDALQFARFLPAARARANARIVFESPPELATLFEGLEGIDELIVAGTPPPAFDRWIPLASLPGILGTTLDALPADTPYIRPPTGIDEGLAELLRLPDDPRLIVGIVWRGNPRQARDVVRSCPPRHLSPLLETPAVQFFSLQAGNDAFRELAEVLPQPELVIDLGGRLRDFRDTAAALRRLDLLISVDTAAAHLAGALGRPVWTLLCRTPDWRWGLARDDSPWYPTMRLFRQERWGDWPGVIAAVGKALAELAGAPNDRPEQS
ncbi:MAG: tetratricopeptide repeat protein [Planctomycetales bacterium]